jgi:hypothetical protein
MQILRYWSFAKVFLACVALFLLSVVVMVGWFLFQARGFFFNGEGAGIGVVSIGINTIMFAIPIIPPIVLIVAWLLARRATPI